jgi:type IV fimbrial biogenesis protein FimT
MNKLYGFTLVELLVTLTIAAILLAVGVPSFRTVIQNNRLITGTNDLVSILNFARSEAVTRGIRVTVCKSSDQAACDTSSNGWEQGWIVFTDENNNAAYNPTATPAETLLRVHEGMESQLTATGNTNVADYISYVSSGQSQLTGGAFQAGTIQICDDRNGDFGRDLVVDSTGRIRTSTGVTCP